MRSLTNSKITNINLNRLDAFIKRCKRCSYCPHDFPSTLAMFLLVFWLMPMTLFCWQHLPLPCE